MEVIIKKAKDKKYLNVSFDLIEFPDEGDVNDFYEDPLKYHLSLNRAIGSAIMEYRKKNYKKQPQEVLR